MVTQGLLRRVEVRALESSKGALSMMHSAQTQGSVVLIPPFICAEKREVKGNREEMIRDKARGVDRSQDPV